MKRSKATNHWPWLLLLLVLVLSMGGFVSRYASPREKPGSVKQRLASSFAMGSPGEPSKDEVRSTSVVETDHPKVHRAGSKARVRVRPGETAVMGYYEIAPGHLGLTVVTPEAREDGMVSLQVRSVELPDSAAVRERAQEVLPDIFELERSGVISKARLDELMRFLLSDDRMKSLMYPTLASRPGQVCTISNVVSAPGTEALGTSYAVQADVLPGGEGYDVFMDYQHTGTGLEE